MSETKVAAMDANEDIKTRPSAESDADLLPEEKEQPFDLNVALEALGSNSQRAANRLQKADAKLCELRAAVVRDSRANFKLERSLGEIDEKIRLLVTHRINYEEAQQAVHEVSGEGKEQAVSPLQGKRALYEEMFYILQSKPRYFAKLTRLVGSADQHSFVQTVVFDMYGDQYDTREERLLLSVFRKILQAELKNAQSKGSLLRANTAVTAMLSAYARRGQGLAVLKDILEEPLKEITSQRDLNLEVKPRTIYLQLIQDYETKTGEQSPKPKNVDDAAAAADEDVQRVIEERSPQLLHWANVILERIIAGVSAVPYGMRWVCKQLGELCRLRFPDATRPQIGSLMGGYIYLRFFNPVIVTPDALNFIQTKPSRIMRRNLILIAKVLQNLSNGLLFGGKEPWMTVLNPFLEEKTPDLLNYFDRLTDVDDVADALQVDKYLEHTHSSNSIHVSFNQCFLIHKLLKENVDDVCKPNDSIRAILEQLGNPPEKLPRNEDRTIVLNLQDRRENRLTTTDAFAEPEVNPLNHQAKTLLLSVLRLLPTHTECKDLLSFLEHEKARAEAEDDSSLADHVNNVCSMLHTLAKMGLLPDKGSTRDTFNAFLWDIATESIERNNRVNVVRKRTALVQSALMSIQEHHQYLQDRLEMYRLYLENVRQGGNRLEEKSSSKKKKKKKKSKKQQQQVYKVNHAVLEESGVIQNVDVNIGRGVLRKCYYKFVMVEPGKFEITLHIKKGFDVKLMRKPVVIVMEDLLTKQEHGEMTYPLEYVDLNVNLLLHLLNKHFSL